MHDCNKDHTSSQQHIQTGEADMPSKIHILIIAKIQEHNSME